MTAGERVHGNTFPAHSRVARVMPQVGAFTRVTRKSLGALRSNRMVKYVCQRCGVTLETDAAPGTREKCPACRSVNVVPEPSPSIFRRLKGALTADVLKSFRRHSAEPENATAGTESPPGEISLEAWVRHSVPRVNKPKLYFGLIFGGILVVAGALLLAAAFCMDVAAPGWVDVERVVKLDLLNIRLVRAIVGTGLILAGIITCCLNRIHASLWKIAQRPPDRPR